jgi:hypothetical protein
VWDRLSSGVAAILIALRVTDIAFGGEQALGYQKDVMDVELMAHYIELQTR